VWKIGGICSHIHSLSNKCRKGFSHVPAILSTVPGEQLHGPLSMAGPFGGGRGEGEGERGGGVLLLLGMGL